MCSAKGRPLIVHVPLTQLRESPQSAGPLHDMPAFIPPRHCADPKQSASEVQSAPALIAAVLHAVPATQAAYVLSCSTVTTSSLVPSTWSNPASNRRVQ